MDGTFHEVDSSELAFKMAGIFALKEAAKKANAILLEPIMKVEVTTPDEYQGDLLGDLNRRRGKIVAHRSQGRLDHRDRRSAAGRDVRLRHGHSLAVEGPRGLFDGAVPLRAGAGSIVAGILDIAKGKPAARA